MNNRIVKRIILALVATACAVGLAYYLLAPRTVIVDYTTTRDKQFILSLFDKDWYWLSGFNREDVDTDLFLERKSPTADTLYAGKLIIKVMYANKQPVGFVAYFLKSFYEGVILFIDVDPEHRRHKYGRALLNYAVDDLRKRGVFVVRLVTRPSNHSAQALYKSVGFKEYRRNDEYVYFEKRVK